MQCLFADQSALNFKVMCFSEYVIHKSQQNWDLADVWLAILQMGIFMAQSPIMGK